MDDIDRLNTRDNLKLAEEDEERNKKNQVLETLDRAYKSSVKKVEHLMERHMDVSKDSFVQTCTYFFQTVTAVCFVFIKFSLVCFS